MTWQYCNKRQHLFGARRIPIQASVESEPLLKVNGVEVLVDGKHMHSIPMETVRTVGKLYQPGLVYRQW